MSGDSIRKLLLGLGALALLVGGAFYGCGPGSPRSIRSAFEGNLQGFLDIPDLEGFPVPDDVPGRDSLDDVRRLVQRNQLPLGYRRGRMLVLDRKAGKIDDLHFALPRDVRARTPEEVGTVVWIDKERVLMGSYSGPPGTEGKGYSHEWYATIIDYGEKQKVGLQDFHGSSPLGVKLGEGDRDGTEPSVYRMLEHFAKLPLR